MRYDSKENIKENIDKLILKVCNYNDISRRELMSKSRLREIAESRQIIMYILRRVYRLSFQKIADIFGKTHATVLYAVGKIKDIMSYDQDFKLMVKDLSA